MGGGFSKDMGGNMQGGQNKFIKPNGGPQTSQNQ